MWSIPHSNLWCHSSEEKFTKTLGFGGPVFRQSAIGSWPWRLREQPSSSTSSIDFHGAKNGCHDRKFSGLIPQIEIKIQLRGESGSIGSISFSHNSRDEIPNLQRSKKTGPMSRAPKKKLVLKKTNVSVSAAKKAISGYIKVSNPDISHLYPLIHNRTVGLVMHQHKPSEIHSLENHQLDAFITIIPES